FRPAGRGEHPPLLLLHVRHDPQLRALAAGGLGGAGAATRDHGLPARLRDAADHLRRAVRRQALGTPAGRLRPHARHLVLDEELPHRAGAGRPGRAEQALRVLRPDQHAARRRAAMVGRTLGGLTHTTRTPRLGNHRGGAFCVSATRRQDVAFSRFTRPYPKLTSRPGSPRSSTDAVSAARQSSGVPPCAAISAATAEACGVAIDVPDAFRYPPSFQVDRTSTPGAATSTSSL